MLSSLRLSFSPRMRLDLQQRMWDIWCSGEQMDVAGAAVGFDRKTVFHRITEAGGIRPRRRQTSSRLSYEDRVHIEIGLKHQRSIRAIAGDLGRAPSTISREIARYRSPKGPYVAKRAHALAFEAAKRPQVRKIDANPVLRARVIKDLTGRKKWSPQQIAGRLARDFGEDQTMTVHHETIYRWIYLQARGELKHEVAAALRSGRAIRMPAKHRAAPTTHGKIPDMVSIHDRPPVDTPDGIRIPGHWEGDLILGKNGASAIGTLVERATGYLMLIHLPDGRTADLVAAAVSARLAGLPERLRQSLTWDQGKEMTQHKKVTTATGIKVYFADPRTPWHRPSNENTNGLLRQYFPKGTDLSVHTAKDLALIEDAMNDRPRARLDFAKPNELIAPLLLT